MKRLYLLIFCLNVLSAGHAQTVINNTLGADLAWYPSNHAGYKCTGFAPIDFSTVPKEDLGPLLDDGRDLGKQGYEGIVRFIHSVKMPFLQGSGVFTEGNNLEVQLVGDVSPVTAGAGVKTILTPAAFVSLDASLYAGSGWSLAGLNGLAVNTLNDPYSPVPLGGLYLKTETGISFKFDLSAVIPGDWTHVVTVYRPALEYQLNTAAAEDEPWQWQADQGENFNGWNWLQTFFIGYQTPELRKFDTVGVAVETEQRVTRREDSTMDEGGWGSDFMKVNIAPVAVVELKEGHKLTIQFQFARERDYTDATVGNESFLNRSVDSENPSYWYFRRIAFSYRMVL